MIMSDTQSHHCPNCESLADELASVKDDRDLWKQSEGGCSAQYEKLSAENERLQRECREQRLTLIAAVVASGCKIVIGITDAIRAPDYELRKSVDPSNGAFILTAAPQEAKP
jgi:hypothetical protein